MPASHGLEGILAEVTENPDRWMSLVDASDEALIAFDLQRTILAASSSGERFFGYDRGDLIGKGVDVVVPARFRQADPPAPARTLDVTTVELPALRRDGSEVMTVWSYGALPEPHSPVFLMTVRERAQALAERETMMYAAVFEHSPVPLVLAKMPEGIIVVMNQAFAELFELRREDFIGRKSTELAIATPAQRDEIARLLAEQGSVRDFECERRSFAGQLLHISLSVTRLRIGTADHLLSTVQDVSQRNAQDAALALARARADYAVRLSGIGFWYCDLPFDELAWDAQVKQHFFLPPEARVTIDTFYERIVPDDRERTRAAIDVSIRDHGLYDVNYRTHDPKSGRIKWIRAMGGTSYDRDGRPTQFDGVTVDITAQKHDEERLASTAAQLEDANRVKDEFLAMLGHELRNPLAPITTAVQLLKMRGTESREINIIERQAKHLARLVDDLLDVSRITRGKVVLEKKPCEVAELVAAALETVSPLIESAHHSLSTDVPTRGLLVDVDRFRIVQVLSNLLANAAKYTPPRGQIRLTARREGGDVLVHVEDTGEGIPEALLPHIFEMFVQVRQNLARSEGGLGLGLAIVKSLVTMHGGQVSVATDGPGRGSTFTVRLPAADAAAEAEESDTASVKATKSKRVLVVDDNVDGAEMVSEALEMWGYETAMAHDGAQALGVAASFMPDLVLVDIGLPTIDGYEFGRRLRETRPDVPMVAITGYGQPEDKCRSLEAGFQAHLTKPVDLKKLADVVETLAARGSS